MWGTGEIYNHIFKPILTIFFLFSGKQKDFFTRSWGVDFVDSSLLPSSPHICELPPNSFDKYLRKVRKYYSRHSRPGIVQQPLSPTPSPGSSRETTPLPTSPLPQEAEARPWNTTTPPRTVPEKLDVPSIFLDQNFDLSNQQTFNTVFPFLKDSFSDSNRLNPFQLDAGEAHKVRVVPDTDLAGSNHSFIHSLT